ncbi:MAG TPA: hypothetical protein VGR30_04340 [Candidatus Binatia bacterium]|jgi:hypothetical protein|nr:hypothetical protein [Candidatus Binatia bacterium]
MLVGDLNFEVSPAVEGLKLRVFLNGVPGTAVVSVVTKEDIRGLIQYLEEV